MSYGCAFCLNDPCRCLSKQTHLNRSLVSVVSLGCPSVVSGDHRQFSKIKGPVEPLKASVFSEPTLQHILIFNFDFFSVLSHTVWTALNRDRVSLVQSFLNTHRTGICLLTHKVITENTLLFLKQFAQYTMYFTVYPTKKAVFKAVRGISSEQNQTIWSLNFPPTHW